MAELSWSMSQCSCGVENSVTGHIYEVGPLLAVATDRD